MIEQLTGPADHILWFRLAGQVSDDEIKAVVESACSTDFLQQEAPCLLLEFTSEFRKFTTTAFWDHRYIGLHHSRPFIRTAIVADIDWIVSAVAVMQEPESIRTFALHELDLAGQWLSG